MAAFVLAPEPGAVAQVLRQPASPSFEAAAVRSSQSLAASLRPVLVGLRAERLAALERGVGLAVQRAEVVPSV